MFAELLRKEMRQTGKSLIFLILLAALLFFYNTQVGEFTLFTEPREGQEESYGLKRSTDKQQIMGVTLALLAMEYEANSYISYPIGFYKKSALKENEQKEIHQILEECTGLKGGYEEAIEQEEPENVQTENNFTVNVGNGTNQPSLKPAENLTYDRFLQLMKKADEIIGGGTNYAPEQVKGNVSVSATYDDALKIYEDSLYVDKISRGKARLFCDYMGILLGIIPVFLAVARGLNDRRASMSELIYVRKVSSWNVVATRFLAALIAVIVPLFLLSLMPTFQCIYYGHNLGVSVDVLAYTKHILGWLLPGTAFVLALGFFLTELTGGPVAVLIQGLIWFVSIFLNTNSLVGSVGWNLIPRFNNDQNTEIWRDVFPQMIANRLLYGGLAVLLLLGTVGIFGLKRKGVLNIGRKKFNHRKDVS